MDKIELPLWYKQISIYKQLGRISFGLTIPYIIGSYQVCNQGPVPIRLLIHDIIDSNNEKCALIQMCPDIHQYVIGLENREFCELMMKDYISFYNSSGKISLIICPNAKELGNNLEGVIKHLEDLYSNNLRSSKFSWILYNKEWIEFTQVEIETILKVI